MQNPNNDLPQLMLQSAAQQFIYELQNAGFKDAAAYLKQKYMTSANEGARVPFRPIPKQIKEELITG